MYFTGYLTKIREDEITNDALLPDQSALKIPNREVADIFRKSVKSWFAESAAKSNRNELFKALWSGDAAGLTEIVSELLFNTISYHDYRESFYHAFLVGLLSNAGYQVSSNYESGLGRSDIIIKDRRGRRAAVIEAKWTDSRDALPAACRSAVRQINEKKYAEKIVNDGYRTVLKYGIAFYRKECLAVCDKMQQQ